MLIDVMNGFLWDRRSLRGRLYSCTGLLKRERRGPSPGDADVPEEVVPY